MGDLGYQFNLVKKTKKRPFGTDLRESTIAVRTIRAGTNLRPLLRASLAYIPILTVGNSQVSILNWNTIKQFSYNSDA